MTEAEWRSCTDPQRMQEFLRGQSSDRKLRLFAVACCRRVWHLLREKNHQKAVEVAERYADGIATPLQLRQAEHHAAFRVRRVGDARKRRTSAAEAAARAASPSPVTAARFAADASETPEFEWQGQCELLRDLFPCFFCPTLVDPIWLTPTVLSLAQAAYDNRNLPSGTLDNARLAVLADALEDAGCTETTLLEHLRSSGPHCRGCWVMDLILSKDH